MSAILIIEDCEEIRVDLAELLSDEGYQVVTAQHGAEALTLLEAGLAPSLILLDLMMPVMDGWHFREQQLGKPQLASIPVLLLTGASNAQRHARDLNVEGYLEKPFSFEELLRTVGAVVARASVTNT